MREKDYINSIWILASTIAFTALFLGALLIYQSRPDRVSTAVPTLSNEKSCTGCPHGIEENINHP